LKGNGVPGQPTRANMSQAKFTFEAQPPSTVAFEEFQSVSPAFLLAKVDGDELVHILESQPQTPFDTPRLESQLELKDVDLVAENVPGNKKSNDRSKQATSSGPKPISERPDTAVKAPKQALDNFEVPAPRPGHDVGNPASQFEENENDSHLQGPWQEFKGVKWSVNHAKILLLLTIYSDQIKDKTGKVWIRLAHLVVVVFEGIQGGIFNLRAAPSSIVIPADRDPSLIWWNVPCGLVACIHDLCREKLCSCIRLVDLNYTQSTAYRVTSVARQFISQMPDALQLEMSSFLEASQPRNKQALNVEISVNSVSVTTPNGFERRSEIDACAKVPFVTSPYIPLSLRFTNEACSDNAGFAPQCAGWNDFPSSHRVESMCFGNVSICLCEYLPLGPNMIQSVSETLGSRERSYPGARSKNGFILQQRQKDKSDPPRFTRATPLDWNFVNQINYEASILHSKNEVAVRNLEEFGVHINQDGTALCGLQLEAVSDKEWDDISPELLAKVLYQIHLDSTVVVDNAYPEILFEYLDCIYFGQGTRRIKYACLIADLIEPKLSARQYKDNRKYENELSWVIGDIIGAEDLGDTDLVLIGSKGVLLAGAHARDHEKIATTFAALKARSVFLDQFFQRVSSLSDELSKMYLTLLEIDEDQGRLDVLNRSILDASSVSRKLNSVLGHFTLSAQSVGSETDKFDIPKSAIGSALHALFHITEVQAEQLDRANDLKILMTRINEDLSSLMELSSFEERKNVARCFSTLQRQTLHLAREKGAVITHSGAMILSDGCAIRLLVVCFSGLLASRLLDRINSSSLTNANAPHWFANMLDGNVNAQPFLLFAVQILIILVFCIVIHKRTSLFEQRSVRFVRRKLTLNLKIKDLMALFRYLDGIGCDNVLFKAKVIEIDSSKSRIRGEDGLLFVTYLEKLGFKWFGESPKVTLEIDVVNGWIKTAEYSWNFWADAQIKVNLLAHIRDILLESGAVQE